MRVARRRPGVQLHSAPRWDCKEAGVSAQMSGFPTRPGLGKRSKPPSLGTGALTFWLFKNRLGWQEMNPDDHMGKEERGGLSFRCSIAQFCFHLPLLSPPHPRGKELCSRTTVSATRRVWLASRKRELLVSLCPRLGKPPGQ